ncbi:unnamed protein product [Arctia plantaginis]|uniref:Uncharacterized protein n=1 Tax=Arctia plantaginis TaxID=874455 RepID=A0A8S0Z107_ARCPL|nr:unnamed protein product [Arctia plantaginis]
MSVLRSPTGCGSLTNLSNVDSPDFSEERNVAKRNKRKEAEANLKTFEQRNGPNIVFDEIGGFQPKTFHGKNNRRYDFHKRTNGRY